MSFRSNYILQMYGLSETYAITELKYRIHSYHQTGPSTIDFVSWFLSSSNVRKI